MVPTFGGGCATSLENMTEPALPARGPEQSTHDNGTAGPSRLGQAVAVVGIVAGVVFVVVVVFFTGAFVGGSWGGYGGPGRWHDTGQMRPGGKPGTCPMMNGGGMMGPGQMGPGMMGPSSPSSSGTTTVPRPLGP